LRELARRTVDHNARSTVASPTACAEKSELQLEGLGSLSPFVDDTANFRDSFSYSHELFGSIEECMDFEWFATAPDPFKSPDIFEILDQI
jgi:hypothetical protein